MKNSILKKIHDLKTNIERLDPRGMDKTIDQVCKFVSTTQKEISKTAFEVKVLTITSMPQSFGNYENNIRTVVFDADTTDREIYDQTIDGLCWHPEAENVEYHDLVESLTDVLVNIESHWSGAVQLETLTVG